MIVGVADDPISPVLLTKPSSMPPKQYWSVQYPPVCHWRRNRRPVEFCSNVAVIPAVEMLIGVAVHSPAVTTPLIGIDVVVYAAVIVVGVAALA